MLDLLRWVIVVVKMRALGGCVKNILPRSAKERLITQPQYYFDRHIVFEISRREMSKTMCLSKDNLARSAVKSLFTHPHKKILGLCK